MPVDPQDIRAALEGVVDPELGGNIVELGMVRDIEVRGADVTVKVALTIASCPLRTQLKADVERYASGVAGIENVTVEVGAMTAEERSAVMSTARRNARDNAGETRVGPNTRVLAIGSGKGGVGKSSVTANLATGLAAQGFSVGVLDADITGFSLPRLLGVDERLDAQHGRIIPHHMTVGDGELRVVSMGLIEGSGDDEAVMLRGLMLNRALQHFLEDVDWGDIDYLIIDLPPGTSDVQMGLARMLPQANLLVVTTPALAAQNVAARAVDMARRSHQRVAGIVENMSVFTCDHGTKYALFGEGGGERLARNTGVPLLASLPFSPDVVTAGDAGTPLVQRQPEHDVSIAYSELCKRLVTDVLPPVQMDGCVSRLLDAIDAALPRTATT